MAKFQGFCGRRSPRAPKGRRWGSLRELNFPFDPFDDPSSFQTQPLRLKLLAAWRRLHTLERHAVIRTYARRWGVSCSSNIGLRRMLSLIEKLQGSTYGTDPDLDVQRQKTDRSSRTRQKPLGRQRSR